MFFMQFNKIVLKVFIILSCTSTVVLTNKILYENVSYKNRLHQNLIVETMMNIINTCYHSEINSVVFAGSYKNFTNWYKNFPPTLSMYLINLSETKIFERHQRLTGVYTLNEYVVSKLRYPQQLFIVSQLLTYDLNSILARLKKSILWNARAVFFLIDEDPDGRCANAAHSLTVAWKLNILYATYVCYDNMTETIQYYTFNPFSNRTTSEFFKIVNIVNGYNRDQYYPMAILKFSSYFNVNNSSMCASLVPDKTRDLDGYPIKMCGITEPVLFEPKSDSILMEGLLSDFEGLDAEIGHIIWQQLGTDPWVTMLDDIGYVDENNGLHGIIHRLISHDFDLGGNGRYRRSFWRLETYPHHPAGLCTMTRRKSLSSGGTTEVLAILEPSVFFFIVVASCVITTVLKGLLGLDLVEASFEYLRALTGVPTLREPKGLSERALFYFILLVIFAMNTYFGSRLTSSFAVKSKDPNVNTIEELIRSEYRLLGQRDDSEFLNDEILRQRVEEIEVDNCLKLLPVVDDVSCLCDCFDANLYALKDADIYVSDELYKSYFTYIVREDWPLLNQVNLVMRRMHENGLIGYIIERTVTDYKMKLRRGDESVKMKELKYLLEGGFQGKPLKVNELKHSFFFYILGISIAVSVFIGENFSRTYRNTRNSDRLDKLKIFRQHELIMSRLKNVKSRNKHF